LDILVANKKLARKRVAVTDAVVAALMVFAAVVWDTMAVVVVAASAAMVLGYFEKPKVLDTVLQSL
jgi:hypothetical protein